jgi:hypothetical protein
MAARCLEEAEEYRQKERKASGRRDTMVQSFACSVLCVMCDGLRKNEEGFEDFAVRDFFARAKVLSRTSHYSIIATTKRWDFDP